MPPLSVVSCRKTEKAVLIKPIHIVFPANAMALISSTDFLTPLSRALSRPSVFQGIDSQLIRCDIVFGMPSQDCRGTGICKLTSDVSAPLNLKNDCRNSVAFAGKGGEGDQVVLVFFRELLCSNLYSRQFRKGVFEMTEPCPLPVDLTEMLELKGNTLLPGRYAILEQDGCFRITISCGF